MAFDTAAAKQAGYSDLEIADYLGKQSNFDTAAAIKAGYSPTELIAHLSTAKPATPASAGFSGSDIATAFKSGAVGSTKALTDVAGATNVASQALGTKSEEIQKQYSPARQAEMQAQAARMKEAEASGSTWEEIKAGTKSIAEAPLQAIAQGVGSFVPYLPAMLLGPVGAAVGLSARTVAALTTVANVAPRAMGTAQGIGAVKGTIYDTVYAKEREAGLSEADAKEKAQAAQEYTSKNIDQMALAGVLGYVAGSKGVERLLTPKGAAGAAPGATKRIGKAALEESLTEAPQGGQERMAANIALQRQGYDVPTFQGVAGQAVQEGLTGALSAGPVGAVRGRKAAEAPTVSPFATTTPEGAPTTEAPTAPVAPTVTPLAERPYAELAKEVARISALAKQKEATPAEMAELKNIRQELTTRGVQEIQDKRAADEEAAKATAAEAAEVAKATAIEEAVKKKFPGLATAEPDLFGEVRPPAPAVTEEAAPVGLRDVIAAELPATTEVLADAGIAPTAKELEAAGQQRLDLRRTPAGQPTAPGAEALTAAPTAPETAAAPETPTAPIAEPTKRVAPTALTPVTAPAVTSPEVFGALGIGPSALIRKPGHPMLGLDISVPAQAAEVKRGLEMYREGRSEGIQQKIDTYLARPEFQDIPSEPTNVKPARTQPTATEPLTQPGRGEPSVGVPVQPVEPTAIEQPAAKPAAPAAPGELGAPVGLGLVPPRKPLGPRAEPKGKPAPALAKPAPGGMFGSLVRPGAADITEEAPAPKAGEPSFDWGAKGGPSSVIGEALAPTAEETKSGLATEAKARRLAGQALSDAERAKRAADAEDRAKKAAEKARADEAAAEKARQIAAEKAKVPLTEAQLSDAVNGKSVLEVADWAAANMASPEYRLLATRIAATLRELQATGLRIGNVSVTKLPARQRGATRYGVSKTGGPSSVQIQLASPGSLFSGTNPETIIHELFHAATMGTLYVGNRVSARNTRLGQISKEMFAVAKAVVAHVEKKQASGATLTSDETRLLSNYMRDVDELLVWGMTNESMRNTLETIPYKGTNAWDKFVTLFRDMLRLPPKAHTALSEIMRIGGELTSLKAADLTEAAKATGMRAQISPESMKVTEEMAARAPLNEKKRISGVEFRTLVTDSMASAVARINKDFQGAIRNSKGVLNPVALMRQAADSGKFLESFLLRGGFRKDMTTGTYEVYDNPNIKPPAEVFRVVQALADKYNMPLSEMQRHVSVVLEGVRLHGLRDAYKKEGKTLRSHMTDAQIDTQMASYNATPELKQLSKIMDDARIQLVDEMVRVGRLTPDMGADWKNVVGYVPFDRMEDLAVHFAKSKKPSGKGIGQLGKLPEFVGSYTRPVGDVFQNYIGTVGWMLRQVTTSDATIHALEALESMGEAKNIGPNRHASKTGITQIAYKNGVPTYFDLPTKYDKMAFADPAPPPIGMLRLAGKVSNVLRTTVTALPPFALKQIFDDTQRAVFNSGVKNPMALIGPSFKGFFSMATAELMGKTHPIVTKLGARGLVGEVDYHPNESAAYLTQHMGLAKRTRLREILHRLEGITRASDLAVRNAVYEQTLKESVVADMPGGDKLLAEYRARELINFRRRGSSTNIGVFISTIPFFNAYLQGTDLVYRNATGTDSSMGVTKSAAAKQFATRAAFMFGFSLLYALAKSNDDDYNKMSLRTRNANWIIGGGLKIPVAGELSALFKVPAEMLVEYGRRYGGPEQQAANEAVGIAMGYILEQFGGRIFPVPQVVKPLLEAWTNYSFLTGRPLEGKYQQGMDAHLRKSGTTSGLATTIADLASNQFGVEVSPILIDNTLDGYFGTASAMTKMLTDGILNPNKPGRPLEKWLLLSNYMYETGETAGTRPMDEFYKLNEATSMAAKTMNELARTDVEAAVKYAETHANEIALNKNVQHTLIQLSKLREAIKVLSSTNGAEAIPDKTERDATIKELRGIELETVKWVREVKNDLNL